MRTIWKIPLDVGGVTSGEFDLQAIPVYAGLQDGRAYVWVQHNPYASEKVLTEFQVFGTGHDIPPVWSHIQSWQDGPFVWHLYWSRPYRPMPPYKEQ